MGEVDEKDETEEDEDRSSNEGYIIAPEHEKAVGNEEADGDEENPQENLRAPPSEQAVSATRTRGEWKRTHSGWRPSYPGYLERR